MHPIIQRTESCTTRKARGFLLVSLSALSILIHKPVMASPESASVEPGDVTIGEHYSPFVGRAYPDQALFGDMHFHTELSFDAGLIGTTLDVDAGYRFARGETVTSNSGQKVQLIRPLDFLFITDHAEMLGLPQAIRESDPLLLSDPWGKWIYDRFNSGQDGRMEGFADIIERGTTGVNPFDSPALVKSVWQEFVAKADQYNDPGVFSAMTGFEWSSTPNGNNLHRVVVFADGAEKTEMTVPFSTFDSDDPQDLWAYLERYEAKTSGRAMAIPHNGNVSNGQAFSDKTRSGDLIDAEYATNRIRWEPIIEVTQIKGDGETHPFLSTEDEFADFENWDVANLDGSEAKEDWMLQYEYGRSALKLGLKLEEELGANPYKFGLTGATDSHTGLSTSREENFFGKYKHTEPSPDRHNRAVIPAENPDLRIMTSQEVASGLTAVWARENTRKDIFDALVRKEVYATTGTRIRVRIFAGYDFTDDDVLRPDFVAEGYSRGVPMGGTLGAAPGDKSPGIMVRAIRDPDGANLDRVQVIKGWLDSDGELRERIFDIAVSGEREIGDDGRARAPVGNTVDIANATYLNSIGATTLSGYWTDPDFDPVERAFYYVRVLEIPTPRWTTYDAAFYDIPLPDTVPPTIQDRAYTSPVWYSPVK
jgi:hypothetical protein